MPSLAQWNHREGEYGPASRRKENLQAWECPPHTCLTCAFSDIQALAMKNDVSLRRNLKDMPTIAGQNAPDFKQVLVFRK